jgi:hypothetical protein
MRLFKRHKNSYLKADLEPWKREDFNSFIHRQAPQQLATLVNEAELSYF